MVLACKHPWGARIVSIILTLEQQIIGRLEKARQQINITIDIDGEITSAVADIQRIAQW